MAYGILVSSTGNQTHALCIGRRILNHWITREVPWLLFASRAPSLTSLSLLSVKWNYLLWRGCLEEEMVLVLICGLFAIL